MDDWDRRKGVRRKGVRRKSVRRNESRPLLCLCLVCARLAWSEALQGHRRCALCLLCGRSRSVTHARNALVPTLFATRRHVPVVHAAVAAGIKNHICTSAVAATTISLSPVMRSSCASRRVQFCTPLHPSSTLISWGHSSLSFLNRILFVLAGVPRG